MKAKPPSKNPYIVPALGVVLFSIGLGVGHFWPDGGNDAHPNSLLRSGATTYAFVNPLLECGEIDSADAREVRATKEKIQSLIDQKKRDGVLDDIGLYYRDLNNGPWFGFDEKKSFAPASLLKVPLMMAYYKLLETDAQFSTQGILYDGGDTDVTQDIVPDTQLKPGATYTYEEIVNLMITASDNTAAFALYQALGFDKVSRVYGDLALTAPRAGEDFNISVRDYASFFRILFNATYLSPDSSEQALKTLSKSRFTDGIVAGVPRGIAVAHKFGERQYVSDAGMSAQQLHDCGIVYAPGRPYVLCIMTRGKDVESLERVIAELSRIVYEGTKK